MAVCPRCKLALSPEQYEGQELSFCGNCWGHWVGFGAFEKILLSESYSFSENETATLMYKWAQQEAPEIDKSNDAACPDCSKPMRQMPFDEKCPVVVDRCESHGVWLDSAEIKEIQIFLDKLRKSG